MVRKEGRKMNTVKLNNPALFSDIYERKTQTLLPWSIAKPNRRKKKAQRSTRNRHTGYVNAFKQTVLNSKRTITSTYDGRQYKSAFVGYVSKGYTFVRAV
jgi:hypothetical protein